MIDIPWQPYSRVQLLQHLVTLNQYQTYLEIGCDKNQVFSQMHLPLKEGVDPRRGGTQRMTSDEFFAKDQRFWDLIFIDGLHTYEQVSRDFDHAFQRLNSGGTIVIHDMLPTSPGQAHSSPQEKYWLGDVWRLAFDLCTRSDLKFNLLTMDFGCGIITKGHQVPVHLAAIGSDWQFYHDHYQLLPLTSFTQYFNYAPNQS